MKLASISKLRDRRKAEPPQSEEERVLAKAREESLPWHPDNRKAMAKVMPRVPEHQRALVARAFADLQEYNLLQPYLGQAGRGVQERQRQWETLSGRRRSLNFTNIALGTIAGVVAGVVAGLVWADFGLPAIAGQTAPTVILAVCFAPLGAAGAILFGGTGSYTKGMMLLIANERRALVFPEMVTAQAEVWAPKTLLAWRSHDWRYRKGQPYLWVQLPNEAIIQETLLTTGDYLTLENDHYRANDAAVYHRRSWNRMISDNALDFADVDAGDTQGDNRLMELMPFFIAGLIVIAGFLLVVMTG